MQTDATAWIAALRRSHNVLRAQVEPLRQDQLGRRSYASDWSIAQVLSHLGSQAEIFTLFLDAGLSGRQPPGQDAFAPIWDAWNARSPQAQADDALRADEASVEQFESLTAEERQRLRLELFGMDLDSTGLARMRLGEHAIHTWDIAVALDPSAKVDPDAVSLLIDTLDTIVARSGKPDGKARRLLVSTSNPERHFTLTVDDTVTLAASGRDASLPELHLPAEAFTRLVYGRLDPAHTPPVEASGVDLTELRRVFPGV